MKVTDEILNKYIDRELTPLEINELKKLIAADPSSLDKLKALQLADEILHDLECEAAPSNFTEKLMNQLNVAYSISTQKNYFFRTLLAIFSLGFIGTFIFGISQMSTSQDEKSKDVIQNVLESIGEIMPSFNFTISISSDLMMLIVSGLVLFVLIGTYVIINTHKAFKNNIENLSH